MYISIIEFISRLKLKIVHSNLQDDNQSPVLPVCLSIDDFEPGGAKYPINETDRVTVMGWYENTTLLLGNHCFYDL